MKTFNGIQATVVFAVRPGLYSVFLRRGKQTIKICRIFTASLLVAAAILSASFPANAGGKHAGRFILGYAMKTLYDIDMKDAQAAFNLWGKELGNQTNLQVDIRMYDTYADLMKDFREKKVDFAMVKIIDYFNITNKDNIDLELVLTNVRNREKGHKYSLLTRSDIQFSHLKDLQMKKISILKGDDIGMIFLDTSLMKNRLPGAKRFFASVDEKTKISQVILSVFFGQADACLIPNTSYQLFAELNPQIKQRIKVLISSEQLLAGVGFFRQDYDEALKETVLNTILNLENTARGKQILLLFKSDKFVKIEMKDIKPVETLLKDYRKLVHKESGKKI